MPQYTLSESIYCSCCLIFIIYFIQTYSMLSFIQLSAYFVRWHLKGTITIASVIRSVVILFWKTLKSLGLTINSLGAEESGLLSSRHSYGTHQVRGTYFIETATKTCGLRFYVLLIFNSLRPSDVFTKLHTWHILTESLCSANVHVSPQQRFHTILLPKCNPNFNG